MLNFTESTHTYTNNQGVVYTSMTTVLKNYKEDFEDTADYWQTYKAIQYLTEGYNETNIKKYDITIHTRIMSVCHNMTGNNFLYKYDIGKEILKKSFYKKVFYLSEQESLIINPVKLAIKIFWKDNSFRATSEGTAFHLVQEEIQQQIYKGELYNLEQWEWNNGFNFKPGKMYNEVRLASHDHLIAGTADRLHFSKNNIIHERDWKGLCLTTPIATKEGWTTIKDLKIGDIIFDGNGELTEVTNTSKTHYNSCYRLTFDTNDKLVCDYEHRWEICDLIDNRGKRYNKIMTAEEIACYYEKNTIKLKIKCTDLKNLPDIILPIDPYVLGSWLADGNKKDATISKPNINLWNEIKKRGYDVSDDYNRNNTRCESRNIVGLYTSLKKMNLLKNKHIPDLYLRASYDQRLDLLRGFMDGDGHFNRKRKRCVMSTTSLVQANYIKQLISTLGFKAILIPFKTKGFGKTNIQAYDVCFSPTINPFLIRNKDFLEVTKNKNSAVSKIRYIKAIKKIDTVPTKCLTVESSTHCYLAGHNLIKTHNTGSEISLKSYGGKKMKFPLDKLEDTDYNKYSIQLGGYAFMLENLGYEVNDVQFEHYPKDINGNYVKTPDVYPVVYDKILIKDLFDHFKETKNP